MKNLGSQKEYTIGEEIANSITHGIGAGISIAGLTLLIIFANFTGNVWHIVSFSIYGTSLILLYLASTLYHSFQKPSVKRVFKILDHSAIFLLIAGTYTPFTLVSFRGNLGWIIFSVIWALAIIGISLKVFFIHRFKRAMLFIYILMGWLCMIVLPEMLSTIPSGGIKLLVAGGLSYTLGVVFYVWHKLPYNHAIWHLFVMGGSILHYLAIFYYVLP